MFADSVFTGDTIGMKARGSDSVHNSMAYANELERKVKLNNYGISKEGESPNQYGSVDRASACKLKGHRFDSGQGHVPWLRANPRVEVCRRQLIDVSLSLVFQTLYPSPFLSVKSQ